MRGHAAARIDAIRAPRLAIELNCPVQDRLRDYALANVKTRPLVVAVPGIYRGQSLALCGAGPSLKSAEIVGTDHVFACNSALPYLWERGGRVTAGIGIDQTDGLLHEWATPPPVPYYLASTVDPRLVQHLQAHGRQVVFFHSSVGFADEFDFYCENWPPTYMVGRGFTVLSRFIALAEWMGFERIDIYGADCAFGDDDVTHANGATATEAYGNPLILTGKVDDRVWRTRPDMLMGAVDLVRRVRESQGRIRLIGDTLPSALAEKDEAYLDAVCRTLSPQEIEDWKSDTLERSN